MSAVDVLAVMDAVEGWAREVSDQYIDSEDGFRQEYAQDLRDFREARAAVAELIEANSALIEEWDRQDDGRSKFDPLPAKDWFAAEARFRAALARVGGAA